MRPALTALAVLGLAAAGVAAPPANTDDAPLRAVRFVDKNEGWAVGDHGCVWHTIDGGKSWERQPTGTTASLRGVQFLTPYIGFAVGRTELPHGAGSAGVVLSTADGGATWREMTSGLLPGLNAVQFFDEKTGVVAGDGSNAFPSGAFRTEDGGKSWKMLSARNGVPGQCKAGGIGGGVTEYGVLANRILSPNTTGKWTPPIHDTFTLDNKTGWAVGDLGTILGTTDGGKTWQTLRCGGQKAAILFAHARPEAVPLGAVALLGGKDGYFCVAECFSGTSERVAAVMRAAGGAAGRTTDLMTAYGVPNEPQMEDVVKVLKAPLDEMWLRTVVRSIRTWRPEVIVADEVSPSAPLCDQFVLLHMKEAFTLAADPKAFPDLGLAPHSAKKLYALAPAVKEPSGTYLTGGSPGMPSNVAVTLDLTAFHTELADSAKGYAETAAALLDATVPDAERFRLIAHRLSGAEQHTALMQGIDLAEGGTARRKRTAINVPLPELEKAVAARRRIETLTGDAETMLTQTIDGLRWMPDDMAARAAVAAGMRFVKQGQWTAARELFALTAERYAGYPEAVEAVRWLVRYHASGEVRRRIELGHHPVFLKAAFAPVEASGVQQVSHVEPFAPKPAFRFSSPEAFRQWNQTALDLEPKLASFGGVYSLDPANVMPLMAARRNLGFPARAALVAKQLAPDLDTTDSWQCRLADERRILENLGLSKRTPAECRYTAVKPFLDGQLDDACWKAAAEVKLPDHQNGYPTTAKFASDESFLYVAVACGHPTGKQVPKTEKRSRDADLTGHDRVELLLDLDRDYQTYYRLRVDHRGCVAEDCWGDSTWNPRWFVAVETTATGWTAELAIPLAELTGTNPTAGTIWAMNVVRVVPGTGVQSWGGPSEATPRPEAMGLMRFVGDAKISNSR